MKNVAVIFGGVSSEHDISIISAVQCMKNLDKNKYCIIPIYITKNNEWLTGNKLLDIHFYNNIKKNILNKIAFCEQNSQLYIKKSSNRYKKYCKIDIALIVIHGKNGEDGAIQGMLQMYDIPYSSSTVLGSSITINKHFTKQICELNNIPTKQHIFVNHENLKDVISLPFEYPVVVKPNNLGSSIGISFCIKPSELQDAIKLAGIYDNEIIIEHAVLNLAEYNCAILKYKNKLIISDIEQPIKKDEILSFSDKYKNSTKSKGMKGTTRIFPAKISKDLEKQIKEYSQVIYKELNLNGVVRIDYLYDTQSKQLYLNEINNIPGSLAFYLFKNKGINYSQLLDLLIENAIFEYEKNEQKSTTFNSQIVF